MLKRDNSICWLGAWIDACCLWRIFVPHLNTPGSGFFVFANRPDFNQIAGYDIVVVQRCCTKPQFDFINTCASLGHKVVYDLDDDVFDIPPSNPAHHILGQMRDGFISCVRTCDVVTVSTRMLAKAVRKNVKQMVNVRTKREIPIIVCENRIDERMYAPVRPDTDKLIVGWQGSTSHIGDLLIVDEAIKQLAVENLNVIFQFRGLEPPESLNGFKNVEHKFWMPVAEFAVRMPQWGWSVALAPLTDHPFNQSKSCIKMVEAAYCGIPCLASWLEPYEYFCSFDSELKWLLCAGKNNWAPKIRDLIYDEARRKFLGQRMYNVAMEHFSWRQPHEGWAEVMGVVASL